MKFHIISIFPEAFESFLQTSIIGKAYEKKLFEVECYKLNDFSPETSGHIDDKAFGSHGQVLRPEPLARAIEHVFERKKKKIPVIFFSPRGKKLIQENLEYFSRSSEEYILICGHYEGIDQRIIELFVDYEISLGNYVLTGGELAAQIFMDGIVRLLPGALGKSISHEEESFSEKLDRQKEYPHYTRPRNFRGLEVPEILVSGNHQAIVDWKYHNL